MFFRVAAENLKERVMRRRFVFAAIVACSAATLVYAQDMRTTDPRLYPYLGCWGSDTASARGPRVSALTCIVPVSGVADVDVVSIVDGRIVDRQRIESDTRPHAIQEQGCQGQEKTSFSPLGRRVYLRAEYTCGATGIAGGTMTLNSFLPTGEWLQVVRVRSGSGSIVRAERRTDVGVPSNLPRELEGRVGAQRLAVVTARAQAATPLKVDDIIETMRNTDSAVTRVWLLETAQHFQLTGDQFASLTRADVPAPVLQAMMATPPRYQLGTGTDNNGRSTDAYLSTPSYATAYYEGYYAADPYAYSNAYSSAYSNSGNPNYACCYPVYSPQYTSYSSYSSYNSYNVYPSSGYSPYSHYNYSSYNPYFPYYYYSGPTYTNPRSFPYSTYEPYRPSRSSVSGPVGVRAARVMSAPAGRRP